MDNLEAPVVSGLDNGESFSIVKPVADPDKDEIAESLTWQRVDQVAVRTHKNYFGHTDQTVVDVLSADYEANGYIAFHDWQESTIDRVENPDSIKA